MNVLNPAKQGWDGGAGWTQQLCGRRPCATFNSISAVDGFPNVTMRRILCLCSTNKGAKTNGFKFLVSRALPWIF